MNTAQSSSPKAWATAATGLVWLVLFMNGVVGYSGSKLLYVLFSLIFLALLLSGLVRRPSYGYLFLSVFLWLGFWLKLTVHLIFSYPYGEAIGFFDGSSSAYDGVLWVAIAASLGVIFARGLAHLLGRTFSAPFGGSAHLPLRAAPSWYPAVRRRLWFFVLFTVVALATANSVFGIQQGGLVPRTILIWPMNAVLYWLQNVGLSLAVATLLYWDMATAGKTVLGAYAVILEGYFANISLLSRGSYVFHSIPQILALFDHRRMAKTVSRTTIAVYVTIAGALFFSSLILVSHLRNFYYSNESVELDFSSEENVYALTVSPLYRQLSQLVIDRWIGLEGVMAVSSYPTKGFRLLLDAATEKPAIGKVTFYQEVANAHYRLVDANKFSFATLPGPAAFFYYSGSLWIVFAGLLGLTLFTISAEGIVGLLLGNPALNALCGMILANMVAQLGVAPRLIWPQLFFLSSGIGFLWLIQSDFISGLFDRFSARKLRTLK